jgi:hypothetical protein
MALASYDKLFGGVAGAAEKARAGMRKTYGAKRGDAVFWGTVYKRERRAKRAGARKTKARRT